MPLKTVGGVHSIIPAANSRLNTALGPRTELSYPSAMVDAALISKVKALSVAERLELIGAAWDSLPTDATPVTEAEKMLLDARLADLEKNPSDQSPWSEVRERLKRQLP